MNKYLVSVIVVLVIALGAVSYLLFIDKKEPVFSTSPLKSQDTVEPVPNYKSSDLVHTYENEELNFSFKYPDGFKVNLYEDSQGLVLVLERNDVAQGFQMRIIHIDEDISTIDVDRVRKDLPNILIEDPQEVLLGDAGKGIAFISDDPLFGGKSREVWFVYNKVFYQITTYATYDPLLQAILSTWQFVSK